MKLHTLNLAFLIISFLFSACTNSNKNQITKEISEGWKFKQADEKDWLSASVPGCVHMDLLQNKKIEDPFYRMNEKEQQWIDKKDWEYSTDFMVSHKEFGMENIELVFKGLDTYADVYLNDKNILTVDNMFREWKADCKDIIQQGKNTLRIKFTSPITIGLEKLKEFGYNLPATNDQSKNGGVGDDKVSVFTRKAGYHYGWDWGPRFVTSGIWRPVYLHSWNNATIEDYSIVKKSLDKDVAMLLANYSINSDENTNAEINILIKDSIYAKQEVQLKKGINNFSVDLEILNPKLWWSNGLGEAYLYSIKTELKTDNQVIDEKTLNYGIRTIKIVREPDSAGKSFYVELNGVPVFMKGANYIPNDAFLTRVTPEKYEKVVKSAVDANMNMLRVWGGGIYENDIFYDLCDKYGILIWQDFMFACSMYPGDDEFLENVRQEAIQNVTRLRNHPSIALWCGNNEIDIAWSQHNENGGWGWKRRYSKEQRDEIWAAYDTLFHKILPDVVNTYDSEKFYWPSSPMADFGKHAENSSVTTGDMHYWGVWHGKHKFEDFNNYVGRFMSEYGFQSFPEFETVKSYTLPEDWDIESEVMASHQRSGIGNLRIKEYMGWYYNVPKDFQSLLYVGQVLQAEAMKMAIEVHRRNMPYCMGTLYWQLNDCWPVASWSGMDYYLKWKATHYFAKKAFNNMLITPFIKDEKVNVSVVSDRLTNSTVKIQLQVLDFNGNKIWNEEIDKEIPGNTSQVYFSENIAGLLKGNSEGEVFLQAKLVENGTTSSENLLFFVHPKDLLLPKTTISKSISKVNNGYNIILSSDKLAKNVLLELDGTEGFFTDNYFDITPGEEIEIQFITDKKIERIEDSLKIISLVDTY